MRRATWLLLLGALAGAGEIKPLPPITVHIPSVEPRLTFEVRFITPENHYLGTQLVAMTYAGALAAGFVQDVEQWQRYLRIFPFSGPIKFTVVVRETL